MLNAILRLAAEAGPGATWIVILLMAVVVTFVLYIGIAMVMAIRAKDPEQSKICYQIFHDLVGLFDAGDTVEHRRARSGGEAAGPAANLPARAGHARSRAAAPGPQLRRDQQHLERRGVAYPRRRRVLATVIRRSPVAHPARGGNPRGGRRDLASPRCPRS